MRGKLIDILLFVVWGGAFLIVAMASPGIANFLIFIGGTFLMGAYNTFVRHDPQTDELREPWRPRSVTTGGPAPAA
jgi:hypothetical protein